MCGAWSPHPPAPSSSFPSGNVSCPETGSDLIIPPSLGYLENFLIPCFPPFFPTVPPSEGAALWGVLLGFWQGVCRADKLKSFSAHCQEVHLSSTGLGRAGGAQAP